MENETKASRPTTTRDLLPSERIFLDDMSRLHHGWFEALRIERGELVLAPPPVAIRQVKFGARNPEKQFRVEFRLKDQVAELFEYTRSIDAGEIRLLEVRGGLPFVMHLVEAPAESGGGPSE